MEHRPVGWTATERDPKFGGSIEGDKLCLCVWYSMKCSSTIGRKLEAEERVFAKVLAPSPGHHFYLMTGRPLAHKWAAGSVSASPEISSRVHFSLYPILPPHPSLSQQSMELSLLMRVNLFMSPLP